MSTQEHQLPLTDEAEESPAATAVSAPPAEDAPSLDDWDTADWDEGGFEGWPVEESPVGPQGVLIPKDPYFDADAPVSQLVADEEEFDSPEERAQTRFSRLSTAFSATLVIVAQMYRDEDWRYLRKDDGSGYRSIVEVCQVAMGKSAAMARRYVQGARDFYLPLSAVMVQGTRLEITSADVATLGTDGIRGVVEDASERLRDVDDPDEATEVVKDSLENARAERDRGRQAADDEGDGWDDALSREYNEDPDSDASGPVYTYGVDDEADDDLSVTTPAPPAPVGSGGHFPAEDDDLISPLLSGAPLFDDEDSLKDLPTPVRRVVEAMLILQDADVTQIARALDYDNRGIIVHSDAAQKSLARIRSVAETQPWVMKQLGHAE